MSDLWLLSPVTIRRDIPDRLTAGRDNPKFLGQRVAFNWTSGPSALQQIVKRNPLSRQNTPKTVQNNKTQKRTYLPTTEFSSPASVYTTNPTFPSGKGEIMLNLHRAGHVWSNTFVFCFSEVVECWPFSLRETADELTTVTFYAD